MPEIIVTYRTEEREQSVSIQTLGTYPASELVMKAWAIIVDLENHNGGE